jgi:cobalt-zinc-cadmium efflux system outer membrane protein
MTRRRLFQDGFAVAATWLFSAAGCCAPPATLPPRVEPQAACAAPARAQLGFDTGPACASVAPTDGPLDLHGLWRLALANNPSLRESAAEVDAARGAQIQAGKYPNPRFVYQEDTIGSRAAPPGNLTLQMTQEIVTGGKRHLDRAIAGRETDAAALALQARRYEVLTRLRRAYYGYLGALGTVRLNDQAVASLQQGVATTRKLVETLGIRPRTDLLRLEALLEETKITQARGRLAVQAAWQQVAAEVGAPGLAPPPVAAEFAAAAPVYDQEVIWQRVRDSHAGLRQAAVEAERARLAVERARAEAVPNITVGAGYNNSPIENTAGALISVETSLPLWDRKQGHIHEAQARWVKAQAAVNTLETSLFASTADAFARYRGARLQVEKLRAEVLPRLEQSLELLQKSYEAGGGGVTFTDVLTTEQSLIATRLTLAEARQNLWQAVADLEGLMQLDIDDEGVAPACPGR